MAGDQHADRSHDGEGEEDKASTEARPAGHAPSQSLEKAAFEYSASLESDGSMLSCPDVARVGVGHSTA